MSRSIRFRLAAIAGGFAIVAALMLWHVQFSWERITRLERQWTASQLESFRLADDFQHRLLKLDGSMLRFAARRQVEAWKEFEVGSAELDQWIDGRESGLQTATERALLRKINEEYDLYLKAARGVRDSPPPPLSSVVPSVSLEEFDRQAGRLQELGSQLADAHRAAQDSFLGLS